MTKSKNSGLSGIPREQKCSFLIGPVSSWFMPNTVDLWTQPNTKDANSTTSYFVYGSIGCFCLGEIHHRHTANGVEGRDLNGGNTNLNQVGGVVNRLADVKNDNSRVSCVRFQKSLPFPIVLVLTETGSLLMYDCLLRENLFLFRKSEVLRRFVGLADDGNQNGSSELPSAKRAKFDVTQQLNSCSWPHPNNLFLGVSLLDKKTCVLIRLKLNNISELGDSVTQDGQIKEEIVASCQTIDLKLDKFTSPICLIESRMLDDKTCLVAVAMDDGLITVICVNLEEDRILRTIKLQRHDNQVCSMSLHDGDRRKFPLGLLASVSRDGLVLVWDLENEFYFADYLAIQTADRNSSAKINWFAIRFIDTKNPKPIYLAVSNVESGISLLKLPENARSKIRLKELNYETKTKPRQNYNEMVTLKHNALIFNIEFDPITQTLISSSLDGNQILWSLRTSTSGDEIKQQFIIPALLDKARTHMLRHNTIKEDLLCLALGREGIKFFSIANNLLNSRFDMSPSCSLVARKIKGKASPTSIAWHPHHEYRLAIGTLEGKVYRADITPRKANLIEAEFEAIKTEHIQTSSNGRDVKHSYDDALGIEYNPMKREDCEGDDSKSAHSSNSNRPKTDGVYSLCWGPNPASPEDITKSAIYAVGSVSHKLFVYCSCNSGKDNSEGLTNYLDKFEDTSLPEAMGQATEVAWKSSMDMMALGTTDGRIIVVAYLDESHQERSNHKLFKHLVTIQGHLGTSNVQCIVWHPTADKEDSSYYKIAASSNESPAFVFNLKEAILIADVKARLKLEQSNGDSMQIAACENLHGSYANKLKAHDKAITDIAWNPHEPNQLATCSFDRTCYVWSIDGSLLDARVIAKFSARDRLFTLDWSLVDEDLIFTSGHDSVVWAWRPSENRHHLILTPKFAMNNQKAYDAGGASGTGYKSVFSDPLALATKPAVIFKFASSVLSLVVYSCVSSAWYDGRCLFNRYNGICRFGSLTLISFLVCVALLILELVFGHISSLKVRRRIAIGDVIVSGVNTLYYLLLFVFLAIAWLKSDYPPFGHSINCCRMAILLSFLAIFALAACTGLAYVRYQSGADATQFMTEDQIIQEQAQYYDQSGNYQGFQQDAYGDAGGNYMMDQTGSYMNYDADITMGQQ